MYFFHKTLGIALQPFITPYLLEGKFVLSTCSIKHT